MIEMPGQTMLFDADDTLWENSVYFERAIASFISYLDHRVHTREEVREHLNLCERATISKEGYGVKSFRRSLVACFEQLADEPMTQEKHQRIVAFTESVSQAPVELLPDVERTLETLARRHRLILVTKGDSGEQHDKLERSGLAKFFEAVEVPSEKTPEVYRELTARHGCNPGSTWMIGNSPRSDINPALAAGLNAIFIPHDMTWVLEHETVEKAPEGQRLIEIARFGELPRHV